MNIFFLVSGSDVGAIVYCDSDFMRLYIDRATYPYIDPTSFALNATGKGCNSYTINKTHVVSMIPLDRCGTIVNEYADLLTFYNNLNTEVTKTKTGITRHPAVEFRFQCSYFRTSTKSLVAFNPRGRIVTRPTGTLISFTRISLNTYNFFIKCNCCNVPSLRNFTLLYRAAVLCYAIY